MKIKIDFKSLYHRPYLIFIVGFLINFQPSNIFNYKYVTQFKDITIDNIVHDLYPLISYSAFILSVFIVFINDFLNYTPLVIIYSVISLIYCCLLIWGDTLFLLQVAQVFFGCFQATEVVYLIFICLFIDKNDYGRFTAYVKIAPLIGSTLSCLLGQLFLALEWFNYKELHYFTLGANITGVSVALFLPFPKNNDYYTLYEKTTNNQIGTILREFFKNIKEAFSDKYIVKWTLWYSLSLCGYRIVINHIQQLWNYHELHDNVSYSNGLISAISSIFCILATYIGSINKIQWRYIGDLLLTITTLLQGFMVKFVAEIVDQTGLIIILTLFNTIYYHTLTSLTVELLENLKKSQFTIVLCSIYCFASVLETIMSVVISEHFGYNLALEKQFLIYGDYYLITGLLFIIIGLISWIAKKTYPI